MVKRVKITARDVDWALAEAAVRHGPEFLELLVGRPLSEQEIADVGRALEELVRIVARLSSKRPEE